MVLLGIDKGTSNSVVSRINGDGKAVPVQNTAGEVIVPTAILFGRDGMLFGSAAVNAAPLEPAGLVRAWKREMETDVPVFTDPSGKQHTAEDLTALFLGHLLTEAEATIGEKVTDVVLANPADAPAPSRDRLVRAAERNRVKVVGLVNEPTAAGVAYAFDKDKGGVFLMFDFGGGTFDATVLSVQSGQYRVLATAGDRKLGSTDFDREMVKVVLDEFQAAHGVRPDLDKDPLFTWELFGKVERAKILLSVATKAAVTVTYDGKTSVVEFTRERYEALITNYVEKAIKKTEEALRSASMDWKGITAVVGVGAPSRTPLVQRRIQEVSGLALRLDVNPDLVVANGAAIYGWRLMSEKGVVLVADGKPLPTPAVKVQDVTAHPLSVLVQDRRTGAITAVEIIPAQTPIPAEKEEKFGVLHEDVPEVLISVVQGLQGAPAAQCVPIGDLWLKDIPVKRGAWDRIRVRYRYDASGIIKVVVTDSVSGKSVSTDLAWTGAKAA